MNFPEKPYVVWDFGNGSIKATFYQNYSPTKQFI